MINVVILIEDSFLISKLESTIKNTNEYSVNYFSDSEKLISYAEGNEINVAVLSLSMPVMNGDEIAESLCGVYPDIRCIFIYEDTYIDLAIAMFNRFDDSMIIDKKSITPDDVRTKINLAVNECLKEVILDKDLEEYRIRELSLKNTMNDMTKILNSRIDCFHGISNIFAQTIRFLNREYTSEEQEIIHNIYVCGFNKYIQDFLIDELDFNAFIDELRTTLNNNDEVKFYQYNIEFDKKIDDKIIASRICFASYFLSHMFADTLNKYRIKIELKEREAAYRFDILIDSRFGGFNDLIIKKLQKVAQKSLTKIADKVEFAEKSGIIQFRLYFVRTKIESKDVS